MLSIEVEYPSCPVGIITSGALNSGVSGAIPPVVDMGPYGFEQPCV